MLFRSITDEALRPAALKLAHDLRDAGCAVEYSLTPAKVGKQFQAASSLGARYAVVIGTAEWNAGEVQLKNLTTGTEERVKIVEIPKRLSP